MNRAPAACLAGVGMFLFAVSAMQAWMFLMMRQYGAIQEPNTVIATAELGLAIFCSLVGISAAVYGARESWK